jgi:hypothetical protein
MNEAGSWSQDSDQLWKKQNTLGIAKIIRIRTHTRILLLPEVSLFQPVLWCFTPFRYLFVFCKMINSSVNNIKHPHTRSRVNTPTAYHFKK